MKYDVFISYSSKNQKTVEAMCAYLEQHKIRCFVAYRDIPKGVVWARAIVDALDESRMMVVVFSEEFNISDQVDREIELASEDHKPILTFRISDADFKGAKKYYLKNLNWIDAYPNPEENFGSLLMNIAKLLDIKIEEPVNAQTAKVEKEPKNESVLPQNDKYAGHEWVDLGLPSGLKWATCNVGAQRPEESGDYYAWGETCTKKDYFPNFSTIGIDNFGGDARYDAARANWGGSWRMPTKAEWQELVDNCAWTWTTQGGVNGYRVTSKKNGNSIFLPAAGQRYGSLLGSVGELGFFWSSTLNESPTDCAYGLCFNSGHHIVDWISHYYGCTVRPVCGSLENEQPRQAQDEGRDAPVVRNDANDKKAEQERWRNLIPMVYVQGGTFTMGATSEQGSDAFSDEKPAHGVTVGSFYMGKYEVTQAQWEAVMGSNPSSFKGSNLPVECVSYDEAKAFCRKLSELTGRTYRLPTEAEWEYAARGGNRSQGYKYSGSNNIDEVAWYGGNSGNSGSTTHAVGSKRANELGLHDMSGNVWEWCSDWYDKNYYSTSPQHNPKGASSGSSRVLRGGSWNLGAQFCRVSNRDSDTPSYRDDIYGFRVVCVP